MNGWWRDGDERMNMITETGCYLDNHYRGRYMTLNIIELARNHGFIVGQFEEYALHKYQADSYRVDYPHEAIQELCDLAIDWLNSGQGECVTCCTGSHRSDWQPGQVPNVIDRTDVGVWRNIDEPIWTICKACSGTGRGYRIPGQNFPPKIPEGFSWGFNDGDFGLYEDDA